MIAFSQKSEILLQSLSKDIETINKRISAIKNVFYKTSNKALRIRLSNEYSFLHKKFVELKPKINLFKTNKNNNLSYSSLLLEKYKRCEKLIYKNNNLFFV